jgi:ankyrin repeat protein
MRGKIQGDDDYAVFFIRALCDLGVDPHSQDENGLTPVDHARMDECDDVVSELQKYVITFESLFV